ncbi:hypothetical protein SLA2020_118010 [Shorea laevis]
MASSNSEVETKFSLFRVYKDGRIELYHPHWKIIPPFDDPITGVRSKDVIISSDPSVSARIFLPRVTKPNQKFALLFYVHGGAFCSMSAFSPQYHEFCSTVAAKGDVIVVSVDVFIAGESAGANISHTLAFGVGSIGLPNVKVVGLLMLHPCFGGTVDDHQWLYMCPVHGGLEDPRLKPPPAHLALLGCERVLIFVAEKDHLNIPGKNYYEELKKSGCGGEVEIVENVGEMHCFHLKDRSYHKAVELVDKFVSFIKP